MKCDEELKLINTVCTNEQRGVQATRKKLVDLSDMNFVFTIGYVLAGLGLAIVIGLIILFPKEIKEILVDESNSLYGKTVLLAMLLVLVWAFYKWYKQTKMIRLIINGKILTELDSYGCTAQWARAIYELNTKIDLETLYKLDKDAFYILMFADLTLHQTDVLKLFKKSALFNRSYQALRQGCSADSRINYQKACDYIKPKALKIVRPVVIKVKKDLRLGF